MGGVWEGENNEIAYYITVYEDGGATKDGVISRRS